MAFTMTDLLNLNSLAELAVVLTASLMVEMSFFQVTIVDCYFCSSHLIV